MTTVEYNCKKCGKHGTAEYDPEWVNQVQVWKEMLTCNRCADYLSKMRILKDSIYRLSVEVTRLQSVSDPEKKQKQKNDIRDNLILVTKKIARDVTAYYGKMNVWSEDFVAQIMERPDKSLLIVNCYEQMVRNP